MRLKTQVKSHEASDWFTQPRSDVQTDAGGRGREQAEQLTCGRRAAAAGESRGSEWSRGGRGCVICSAGTSGVTTDYTQPEGADGGTAVELRHTQMT